MSKFTSKVIARSNTGSYVCTGKDDDYCVITLDGDLEDLVIGDKICGDFNSIESNVEWIKNLTQDIDIYVYYEVWECTQSKAMQTLKTLGSPTHISTSTND